MKTNFLVLFIFSANLILGCKNRLGAAAEANESRVLAKEVSDLEPPVTVPPAREWTSEQNALKHYEKHKNDFKPQITYEEYKEQAIKNTEMRGLGIIALRSRPGLTRWNEEKKITESVHINVVINILREDFSRVTIYNATNLKVITYFPKSSDLEDVTSWIYKTFGEKDYDRDMRGYPHYDHLGNRVMGKSGTLIDLSPGRSGSNVAHRQMQQVNRGCTGSYCGDQGNESPHYHESMQRMLQKCRAVDGCMMNDRSFW